MKSVFLYGPPGSGKSTIGQALATRIGMPYIDLDSRIVHNIGMPISTYMAANGEIAFRDIESETLAEVCRQAQELAVVVSLGGGTLLRPNNQQLTEQTGQVVVLDSSVETLSFRLGSNDPTRPLLSGDTYNKVRDMLEKRKEHYAQFSLRVSNEDGDNPARIVEEITWRLGEYSLRAMGRPYTVEIAAGILETLGERLKSITGNSPVVVVYDSNTHTFFSKQIQQILAEAGIEMEEHIILAGEENKTLNTVSTIWEAFIKAGMDRKSIAVAVGGGVVTDLVGFAASTYMRGCKWLAVPTSLLAMVDAATGGKTGFDLPQGKNLIGSFYPPELVLVDPEVLASLPDAEYRSGMAEVIKHGIIADPDLFLECARGLDFIKANQTEIVKRAVKVKIDVIEEDPYEKGKRASLNLGHTIGHAVEIESEFSLKHGEAIAIGTVAEAHLAEKMGIAQPGLAQQIEQAFSAIGLPTKYPKNMNRSKVIGYMKNDKKKSGKAVHFALPASIGDVKTGIAIQNLEETL